MAYESASILRRRSSLRTLPRLRSNLLLGSKYSRTIRFLSCSCRHSLPFPFALFQCPQEARYYAPSRARVNPCIFRRHFRQAPCKPSAGLCAVGRRRAAETVCLLNGVDYCRTDQRRKETLFRFLRPARDNLTRIGRHADGSQSSALAVRLRLALPVDKARATVARSQQRRRVSHGVTPILSAIAQNRAQSLPSACMV